MARTSSTYDHFDLYLTPMVGWLVVCFGSSSPLRRDGISVYIWPSPRGGDRGERIEENKNVQTTQTAPTAIGPRPTINQIVGRPGT